MGLYDKLEIMKNRCEAYKNTVAQTRTIYVNERRNMLLAEKALQQAKKRYNRSYKNWFEARLKLSKMKGKIKNFPNEVRSYIKRNPFEALERQ